ncbi:Cyclin pch1 [Mycena kentingensis (nom. inval.)]|nr:Cyclin pch1 [Mycena kentingensis (nom. inval.)]
MRNGPDDEEGSKQVAHHCQLYTMNHHQWSFPLTALNATPTNRSLHRELYDRARGIEFLFRLGSSLLLPTSAILTAAAWFHRFYMRFSMEDYHRQDVAASCIFLATKTEECARKLRDVARVCQAKIHGQEAKIDAKDIEICQAQILLTEEALLEALCFDYVVESPHCKLVDLFDAHDVDLLVQECAWSFAHDSFRTTLCIHYPAHIIATACYVLAQRAVDGPNSMSLDARIASSASRASLPTPPTHKLPSPDPSRFAIEHFSFTDAQLVSVAECLSILLEFYRAQEAKDHPHLSYAVNVAPPANTPPRSRLYIPRAEVEASEAAAPAPPPNPLDDFASGRTPNSSHGGRTPAAASQVES